MNKYLFSVFASLLILPGMSQQSVVLKLNLEKNKAYRLRSVTEQTVVQTVSGNPQTVESKVLQTFSIKMIDSNPEFIVAEVRFDTLITSTNTMGKVENFSSVVEGDIKSSETADVMSCIMNRLSKNSVFVKISYAGEPVEILNAKLLSDIILKDTASITITGPTATALKAQITNTVSEGNLKTMIKGFTGHLPGNTVSAGTTWKRYDQINSGGMLLMITSDYRFDGTQGSNAIITVESAIGPPENPPPIQSGGATVTYNTLSGVTRSNLIIDTRTGLMTENKSKTRISGKLQVNAPGFSMEIPMEINSETVINPGQ